VAPGWLLQLSDLVPEDVWESLEARTAGLTRERLVEELAAASAALSAQRPLVLVLEDLHWADASTLATLAALAQRGQRARLLLLASARSGEPRSDDTALRSLIAELKTKGLCQGSSCGRSPSARSQSSCGCALALARPSRPSWRSASQSARAGIRCSRSRCSSTCTSARPTCPRACAP
jgi:hypothetical protein